MGKLQRLLIMVSAPTVRIRMQMPGLKGPARRNLANPTNPRTRTSPIGVANPWVTLHQTSSPIRPGHLHSW